MRVLAGLLMIGVLTACGSGSSPVVDAGRAGNAGSLSEEMDRRCSALGGAGATVVFMADAACPDCAATDEASSIDRADATWAELTAPVLSTGSMTLRATAPSGVVFPAGSDAALTLSIAEGSGWADSVMTTSHQQWHITIRTYLGGELADVDEGTIRIREDTETYRHIVGTTTTQAFDSIEVIFDRPPDPENAGNNLGGAPASQPGSVRVHEFCGEFDLSGLED